MKSPALEYFIKDGLIGVLEPALIEALSKQSICFIEGKLMIKSLVSETDKIKTQLAQDFNHNYRKSGSLRSKDRILIKI